MLFLGTSTGPRTITVRVDDLPETERTLVRETLRCIKAMHDREITLGMSIMFLVACGVVGMMPIVLHYLPNLGFLKSMALAATGGIMASFMVWVILRVIVDRYHDSDALLLSNLGKQARCGQIIYEYAEANPWFAKAIKPRFEQVAAAQ
ncbi:hypothetical protein HYW17_02095 [Candidatus Uhrbacteria bacterium]|nr:hypothetical protein [Candidatus Uhrbacteria bacterium]